MDEVIIAAAGGGKTTNLVGRVLTSSERCALVTYTRNNVIEIERKFYHENRCVPAHAEIWPWYTFLLREMARPYQSAMVNFRISGIRWVEGRSDIYARSNDTLRFYFGGGTDIYSDKLSRFICECNRATHGAVIRRLEERFRRLYIDEIQDMAGYDIDLIELILRSKLQVILVGDHRQATFRTNNSPKNSAYSGVNIIDKFMEWRKDALCALSYQRETYRCNQKIADLADLFFPKEPKTISLNTESTGHDGVFCVRERDVAEYVERYRPQILRLDARTSCAGYRAMNFGDSKGLTFNRVLIFPHKLAKRWLESGEIRHVQGSASKMYVGITRARYSVAFVFDGVTRLAETVAL